MANYLYIFRGGDPAAMSTPQRMEESMKKWGAWVGDLTKKGHFKAGEPLENGGKQVRGRSKTVVDGPYAEAKDLVGGYLLVSAENEDHAVELAKGCPILDGNGIVEVRPVRKMDM